MIFCIYICIYIYIYNVASRHCIVLCHSPFVDICVAVTEVVHVLAVLLQATGALLHPRQEAPPVGPPLPSLVQPPGQRGAVCSRPPTQKHSQRERPPRPTGGAAVISNALWYIALEISSGHIPVLYAEHKCISCVCVLRRSLQYEVKVLARCPDKHSIHRLGVPDPLVLSGCGRIKVTVVQWWLVDFSQKVGCWCLL